MGQWTAFKVIKGNQVKCSKQQREFWGTIGNKSRKNEDEKHDSAKGHRQKIRIFSLDSV